MDNTVGSVADEGEISSFAANGNWATTQSGTNPSNSTLLFIAVEYVKENASADYKFETDASFSPQPSTYNSEFDQHVSPLDPNMSSTARYSPVYSEEPVSTTSDASTGYSTPVVVPLMSTELEGAAPSSGDSCFQDIADADTQLLRQVVGSRYLQMVAASGQIEGADGEESTVNIDYNQSRSPEVDDQIINKELQLVQFPINNYQQQLKVDPDQVELLITDQNTGISYSYVSQDFLVSRTPLPNLPEDEQQLNNVLNTLESHGLVMETNDDEVTAQNSGLTISDGQMMLQDPLLGSDLLLQAPVEITLDDNVLSAPNTLVLKPELPPNQLISSEVLSAPSSIEQEAAELISKNVKKEDFDEVDVKTEFEAQQLRRSRRQNERQTLDEDINLLNRVQTISDKPVPSRARATLPEPYLVINKLPSSPDVKPEYGVFARKAIPKRTQFGPIEGILLDAPINNHLHDDSNELKLLLESETGSMHKLDISDENSSNWMRFVRRAKNFNEQNLILSQQGYSLYFTTTRAILPRQELQVGYCSTYAAKRKLPTLQPVSEDEHNWPCFECPLKFTTSDDLQKHLNVHDENKEETIKNRVKKLGRFKRRPFGCPHCSRTFLRRVSLNRHLLQHNNPVAFRERQNRYIRRNNISPDKIDKNLEWKCGICSLHFPTPSLLNLHELIHKNENSEMITGLPLDLGSGCNEGEFLVHSGAVQCPQCSIEYTNRKSLIEHVSEHGKRQPNEINELVDLRPEQTKKGFKCYLCYKAFASKERLQRHMLVHGSEDSKPIKCDTCSKRFLNNSALTCHLKTHKLDKKIFECPICKISFDQILLLKEHVRCHCIDGIYTCPHCNKIFKEYSMIRKHIRAFHCERKHGCQYCGKPFSTLDKLRMHLLKHSDHREFLCSECGKQFKRKDKLKEHMKRMHSGDGRELSARFNAAKGKNNSANSVKKFMPKVQPTDYHRFIYKCHSCLLGFKRRGMLVNHLAKRHPDISPDSVPELNLPILKTTRDYYCQYCDKVYKSSSKRKAHILKNHPGLELPMSNRRKGGYPDIPGVPNPTFSQTVGSVTTNPHSCQWCHKQYASKAKLLQHQRKKHQDMLPITQKQPRQVTKLDSQQMMMQQQQPQSPNIPEDGKFMNSPDVPDSAVSSTVLTEEIQEVSEEQLNAFTSNGYLQCDDVKVALTANNIKQTYKLAEESLLNQTMEDFEDCRGPNGQYYRLIQMSSGQLIGQSEESVDDPPEPSRLYRLLTANGPFPPYPPR